MKTDRTTRKTINKLPSGGYRQDLAECAPRRKFRSAYNLQDLMAPGFEQEWMQPGRVEPAAFQTDDDVFSWAGALLCESPLAGALLRDAAERGWKAGLADLSNEGYHLDIPEKTLLLDHHALLPGALARSAYFRNALILTFIRALRDIWHENRHGAFERLHGPEGVLMMERVRAADCDAVLTMSAWELRGAGYPEIWRHMIGSAEGDIAMAFSRFIERDPAAFYNGSGLACAFRQWYADEDRVAACDHETLEGLDHVLATAGEPSPFGQAKVTARAIEILSCQPDATAYLYGHGQGLLTDPFYAGLNDPINQTHLFQLMYDLEVVMVNNVPFRDGGLARKIFPGAQVKRARI